MGDGLVFNHKTNVVGPIERQNVTLSLPEELFEKHFARRDR
jgi:hypothetical protein